ncbi:hypothetical protein [Paenibacillus sp. PL2-23]|uniref:hypothetical protein n=1 Tax=Paenibacillus sp. PL2-23 TaxID=2100729 RepID=UPI0030FCAF18
MNDNRDNEIQYKRDSHEETEPSFAATNSGMPNQLPNVNEEMGADFAYGMPSTHIERTNTRAEDNDSGREEEGEGVRSGGYALGWVSLIFAIASWFIWPVLLGASAAVMGYIAYRQGARGIGGWAMAIGLVAIALNLVIVPFYYALT